LTLKLKAKRPGKHAAARRQDVQAAANGFCLRTYGDSFSGGTPCRLTLPSGPLWIVPVMFTSAGYGHVGEVGVVALDTGNLNVLDATSKDEVRAASVRLARERHHALDAAFRRARTT
jgi:hypothetical protein